MREKWREHRKELVFLAAEILLVGTLMGTGALRDTWDYGTPAVHVLTAGTLLNALWYCLMTGRFFLPLQLSSSAVFALFLVFGEMPAAELSRYFSSGRFWDALGMALAGASLAVSASAMGALLSHLIRAVTAKIRTGRASCPYRWEMLLCFAWITVIYLFPLSVRFTEWDFLIESDKYFFFIAGAACLCAAVYSFVRGYFLLPATVMTLISGGMGFFTYSYPEVYTTAHLFNFAENVQFFGILIAVPLTAFAACIGALIGRLLGDSYDSYRTQKTNTRSE